MSKTFPRVSFILGLAEIVNVVIEEHETYPIAAFLSDTGGAAGLFLGLNILGTIEYEMCWLLFYLL